MEHYSTLYVGMDVHRDSFTLAHFAAILLFIMFLITFLSLLSLQGLDFSFLITPFLKCVSSNFSKRTNNPNPSPVMKIWFGLSLSGAGDRTRTSTALEPGDFKSPVSAIPPHRRMR